jgi:hypothetical protein
MAPDRRTVEWRKLFTKGVSDCSNVVILDPSLNEAFKQTLTGEEALMSVYKSDVGKLIVSKDRAMVKEANVLIADLNKYDDEKIVLGTLFELAWAYDDPATTVIVIGDELAGTMLFHPFVISTADIIVKTTEEAIALVRWMAGSEVKEY